MSSVGVSRGEVLSALADGLERVQGALRGAMQASIELRLQQLLGQASQWNTCDVCDTCVLGLYLGNRKRHALGAFKEHG